MLTPAQRRERLTGIGGSDAPVCTGHSRRMTAHELALIKLGRLDEPESDPDDLTPALGHHFEPFARRWVEESLGVRVTIPRTMRRHRRHRWRLAHPDGLILRDREGVEVKMRARGTDWGPDGSDEVPADVRIQCQHYMSVLGWRAWRVVVLIGGVTLHHYRLAHDRALAAAVLDAEADLWAHVQRGEAPPLDHAHPTAIGVLDALHPRPNGTAVRLPAAAGAWVDAREDARARARDFDAAADTATARLLELMGDASIGVLPDGRAVNRRETRYADGRTVPRLVIMRSPNVRT